MAGRLCSYFSSSIGRKQILGLSGLALCGFLLTHLAGNLLILKSQESFNTYAHTLTHNPLIIPMELGLLGLFLLHIVLAMKLTWENRQAKETRYAVNTRSGRGATIASRTMPYTGLLVLIFLILHLFAFRFGEKLFITHGGIEMRDLWTTTVTYFSSPLATGWYVIAQAFLGLHVSHGFASCFQSLGFRHPRYTPCIEWLSRIYGVLIFVGFSGIALWAFLTGGQVT